ncbi:hypothetical protein Ddc_21874 [Ditylenchus destructor]|nr:hypothetical protein Ddc_21874 [Ditylenchus destructor]
MASMDNGTMVEALKYLNYCQLAKNSLVSKRFRNLIQTHRHKLALLYVNHIAMNSFHPAPFSRISVFGNELSREAYNEWVIRNKYSKQAPIESRMAAFACYQDPSHREWDDITTVFSATVELNHENWPVFQHFVRLVTDPFIYIRCLCLIYQNDVLNELAGAINSDHDHLQCEQLNFDFKGNSQKSITWIKNHARCNNLSIYSEGDLNQNEAFLDFLVTGANCTSSIHIFDRDLLKVVTDFVQKFKDLKNSSEIQLVETINGAIEGQSVELFKRDYAKFIVKEERHEDDDSTEQVFEFVNVDIGKKLQLTAYIIENDRPMADIFIKIINL